MVIYIVIFGFSYTYQMRNSFFNAKQNFALKFQFCPRLHWIVSLPLNGTRHRLNGNFLYKLYIVSFFVFARSNF